jgi:FSR family fosmidomycin resistance protein-like MFS transporter
LFYVTARQKRALILTSLTHFVNDGVSMVPLSIFPLLLTIFGLAAPELGVVAAMWNITSVIGSPAVGHLSDRFRRNGALLLAGLAMMAIGVIGTGWSVTAGAIRSLLPLSVYPALVSFAAIGGLGSAVSHPVGGTVLSKAYPASMIGKALGLNGAVGSLGRTLYPTIVVVLISVLNLPYGVALLGILGLIPAALIGIFPLEEAQEDHLDAANTAETFHRENDAGKTAKFDRSAAMNVLVLTTMGVIRGTFGQGVVAFLSVFIVQVQKYSFSFGVGVIMMIAIVLGIPGQIIFGHFSDIHRTASLAVNTAGQSLSIIFYLYTLSNPIIAVICLALFGFFTYSNYPVYISAVSDSVPPRFLSLSNSIVWGVGVLGGSSLGLLIVGLAVGTNLSLLPTIFLTLATASGLSTGLVVFLPRRSQIQMTH